MNALGSGSARAEPAAPVARPGPDTVTPTRFDTAWMLTARPIRGSNLALVVTNGASQTHGRIVDLASGAAVGEAGFRVDVEAVASADGEWILQMRDTGGDEVGHVVATRLDGDEVVDLTPDLPGYVLRGIEVSDDGRTVLLSVVDDGGYHLVVVPASPWGTARCVDTSTSEAWWGRISADGSLASFDVTGCSPEFRRSAVAVVDVATGERIALLDDLPDGPARARRFSSVPGDPTLLVSTERSGYARPCLWNPVTGDRQDFPLPELAGDVQALDWDPRTRMILAVHIDDGIQTVIEIAVDDGGHRVLSTSDGSYLDPDVASAHPFISASFYLADGSAILARSRWETPLHLIRHQEGANAVVLAAEACRPGVTLTSVMLRRPGRPAVQLWVGFPDVPVPRGTLLEVHGGPAMATVDKYSASAQSWLDEGFVYAALNYRGSVTFGQEFRDGSFHSPGEDELADIEDAVVWLRGRGVASASSTFVTGASWGGFLTLLAVGRLPELFTGGLAQVAMADWSAGTEEQNAAQLDVFYRRFGATDAERRVKIRECSPITYVASVRASVWLYQGRHDTRTPPAQARAYAEALSAAGGDVVLEWFDGGHEETGLEALEDTQGRMLELVERSLRGDRWSAT